MPMKGNHPMKSLLHLVTVALVLTMAASVQGSATDPAIDENLDPQFAHNISPPLTGQPRTVQDCAACPEMVKIPAGTFWMGDLSGSGHRDERPAHRVKVEAFLAGKHEVTFDQWDACVEAGGCESRPDDRGWGRGRRPVINVSWVDTRQYLAWLSSKTGKQYRLLTEAEWEYAARAGTSTEYTWGDQASHEYANYGDEACCSGLVQGLDRWMNSSPVGSFKANAFGLHDVHGNVWEWTEDCWHGDYSGAPGDGSARTRDGDCTRRVVRGGSWFFNARELRVANRYSAGESTANGLLGFRIARTDGLF